MDFFGFEVVVIDGWDENQVAIMSRDRARRLQRAAAAGNLMMQNLRAVDEREG